MRKVDEIVPAAVDDYVAVFGFPPKLSFKGFAVRQEGRAVAIAGLYIANNLPFVFCQINGPVRKRTVLRVAYDVIQMARAKRLPLFAVRDSNVPTSKGFIEHFGFVHVGNTDGQDIYQCQQ